MYGDYKIAALCLSGISKEDIQTIVFVLSKKLETIGWKLFVYASGTDLFADTPFDKGEAAVFKLIDYNIVDAVIVYNYTIKNQSVVKDIVREAHCNNKPAIVINDGYIDSGAIDVFFDEGDAFRQLMEHLVTEHNYKRFGCIAGFKDNEVSDARVEVFRDVLKRHNIEFDERFFGYGNFYDEPTIRVLDKFLSYGERLPEVIVCINDSMAVTTVMELQKRGIRVPEDVAVTGFDGILEGRYYYPQITTCELDNEDLAAAIADILMNQESEFKQRGQKTVKYRFRAKASCGCWEKSDLSLSDTIRFFYVKAYVSGWFESSMTNMLSHVSDIDDIEGMDNLIKYYINGTAVNLDTYICMNYDEDYNLDNRHLYNYNPYTKNVIAKRFFSNKKEVARKVIYLNDFIPDMEEMVCREGILIIFNLHNQEKVIGYSVSLLNNNTFDDFSRYISRLQKLVTNLDAGISLFVQKQSLKQKNRELLEIQDKIIMGFADIVESRDDSTGQHVKRTAAYMDILLKRLAKNPKYKERLGAKEQELIFKAAPLHDIGKIKISDKILNKPSRLTDEEFNIIKTHTTEGSDIINSILVGLEDKEYVKIANDVALYHHEKWDGSGYPCGLSGENIPIAARLMAVVDVFDALSSKRVYKEEYSMDKAFSIIEESRGKHFDPDIVDAFLSVRDQIESVRFD